MQKNSKTPPEDVLPGTIELAVTHAMTRQFHSNNLQIKLYSIYNKSRRVAVNSEATSNWATPTELLASDWETWGVGSRLGIATAYEQKEIIAYLRI